MNNNNNNINNNFNNMNNNPDIENQNIKLENKSVKIEKKSAVPIISVGITWIIFSVVFNIHTFTQFLAVSVLSFVVYQIMKKKFPPKKVEIVTGVEKPAVKDKPEEKINADKSVLTPEERELKDLNERIDLYFIEMRLLNDSIDDEFISNELVEIEKILKKIQFQLNDDAQNKRLAPNSQSRRNDQLAQFFDYYMPTTIKILNSYRRIESQNLIGDNALETKKRVEESLPFVRKSFEKELDNMFSDEMLDITTDIDVLEAMMSKDGVIEKNTIGTVRNVSDDMKNDFFN